MTDREAATSDTATTPEPPPSGGRGPSIHDLVIADMQARKSFGLAKYGVFLKAHDGRRSLVDAYQEVLDLAVYLRKQLAEQGRVVRWWPWWVAARVQALLAAIGLLYILGLCP